ncbi:MAG: MMPL family transporter [Phycisphaerae bacterium]
MQLWARLVARTYLMWLMAWPAAGFAIWFSAPQIQTLLMDDDTGFLPPDLPSQEAFAKLKEEFPDHAPGSRAVIVFVRGTGLTSTDRAFIERFVGALSARSEELGWAVHAAASTPYLKELFESRDGQAAVIAVDLPAEFLTHSTVRRVRAIQQMLRASVYTFASASPLSELEIEITGNGALGELLDANTKHDVDRTTIWAFAGVSTVLLLVYRSPVAVMLPLFTIALSLMAALGMLGWSAAAGWPINGLVQMFIIVILAGTGVDYCLFLFARFREEVGQGLEVAQAVTSALARTGGAILASAGTNAVGLATLALARNRDLHTSGPTIALAICVGTFAVLTLTPALMRLVGRHLLWPRTVHRQAEPGGTNPLPCERQPAARPKGPEGGRLWTIVARGVTARPGLIAVVLAGLLLPASVVGWRVEPLYDSYEEYPADSSFVRGARLYAEHFSIDGGVSEVTLIISAAERLDTRQSLPALRASIEALSTELERRFPIAYQRDLNDPLGQLRSRQPERGNGYTSGLPEGLVGRAVRAYYIGRSGKAARIDLGLQVEPRTARALDIVREVRSTAQRTLRRSALAEALGETTLAVDISGESPLYADIRGVRIRDFRVIAGAAIAAIYVILIALLRSPLVSAILVAATLVTYLTAYGATWLVFTGCCGVSSVSYHLDLLLFIVILSLGQDYNIYVVSRIREELAATTLVNAVRTAVSRTGPVVSSCGIIMTAAFASLFTGSLLLMKEFAVALAIGILIDTFIIRPLLVPALILLAPRPFGEHGSRCEDDR